MDYNHCKHCPNLNRSLNLTAYSLEVSCNPHTRVSCLWPCAIFEPAHRLSRHSRSRRFWIELDAFHRLTGDHTSEQVRGHECYFWHYPGDSSRAVSHRNRNIPTDLCLIISKGSHCRRCYLHALHMEMGLSLQRPLWCFSDHPHYYCLAQD